jgi:hypothetical protein
MTDNKCGINQSINRRRYAYAFARELTYELTANEKDYIYERMPVI